MKHIIEYLENRIAEEIKRGNDIYTASWNDEDGILLTVSEAQQIVQYFKGLPNENESDKCKYAVVFRAEDNDGFTITSNIYVDGEPQINDPLGYFANTIESQGDFWNVVVTFFTKVN